jgi:hypothetical protein
MEQLAANYGIKRVVISVYNSKVNGIIKRGHLPIINTFAKIINNKKGNWVQNLYTVL